MVGVGSALVIGIVWGVSAIRDPEPVTITAQSPEALVPLSAIAELDQLCVEMISEVQAAEVVFGTDAAYLAVIHVLSRVADDVMVRLTKPDLRAETSAAEAAVTAAADSLTEARALILDGIGGSADARLAEARDSLLAATEPLAALGATRCDVRAPQ